jgi:hypothetical protein
MSKTVQRKLIRTETYREHTLEARYMGPDLLTFVRDMSRQPAWVTPEWHPDALWVRDGEGVATCKYDGTSCLVRNGKLYKRRELRPGDTAPADFESLGTDESTGKTVGWVPVGDSPDDRWHRDAFTGTEEPGTYELMGPKINRNTSRFPNHVLIRHTTAAAFPDAPRDFEGLRTWLTEHTVEGLVWHHPDGRMAKIKRRDFGLRW